METIHLAHLLFTHFFYPTGARVLQACQQAPPGRHHAHAAKLRRGAFQFPISNPIARPVSLSDILRQILRKGEKCLNNKGLSSLLTFIGLQACVCVVYAVCLPRHHFADALFFSSFFLPSLPFSPFFFLGFDYRCRPTAVPLPCARLKR